MIIKKISLLVLIYSTTLLQAAFLIVADFPQVIARGNIPSCLEISRFSPFNLNKETVISTGYNLPFGLTELARQSVGVSFPVFERYIFISADNFGSEVYRENSLFAAYPAYQTSTVSFMPAVQFNYLSSTEKSYSSVGGGLNFMFCPVNELTILSSATNLFSTEIKDEGPEANYQMSVNYRTESDLIFYVGLEKDQNTKAVIKTGLELKILKMIRLFGGYNFEPVLYTSGVDFEIGGWQFAYGFSYHEILGFSQSGGIIFKIR